MRRRIPTFLLLACLCPSVPLCAQDKPQDKLLTPHSFEHRVTLRANYLLFLPKGYDAGADKRWPLILFLHGAGERGTNVWEADIHGPAKYIAGHPDFPFILVSPQCPPNQAWSGDVLLGLLDEVGAKYKVDPQRVYLTGLSMGGFGAWDLSVAHPERFAARQALKGMPVWAFHGGKDNVVPPAESERMVQALKGLGADEVKLTIYPEATHNSWEQTYSNPEFYQWLLAHKRAPAP
jgi:predicted peptidase